MTSVPFKVKNVGGGWVEANGLLVLDGELLCFQYQTKDAVFGVIKTGVREVKVGLVDVAEMRYKARWTGAGKLIVRLTDMKLGDGVPGHESGTVELLISRQNADTARELASSANLEAAEARLRRTMG